tara:strand:- start:4494 stop:4754 length:261 start_codon:yes stop_codon:yes gene_type:complete
MAEENEVESEEMGMGMDKSNMPSNEILIELFEAMVGEELDESNDNHAVAMAGIQEFLSQNPEIAEALSSGEMTVSQLALKLFKESK